MKRTYWLAHLPIPATRDGWLLTRATGRRALQTLMVIMAAIALVSCEACRGRPMPVSGRTDVPSTDPAVTLRLLLLTDLAGALEPCGCTKDQLGGLDHFGAWVKQARSQAGSTFVAEAGPLFFMDPTLTPEHASQDRAKADTIAQVLHELGFEAFAPGLNDWAGGAAALAQLTASAGATRMGAEASSPAAPEGRPASEIRRVDAGPIRLAFVGYGPSDPNVAAPGREGAPAAIRRQVDAAKALGANVIVALLATGRGEAKRVADANPDLAAVVVGSVKAEGDGNTTSADVDRVGHVLVVQPANHLQSAAVLDFTVRQPPRPGTPLEFADATNLDRAGNRDEILRGNFVRYSTQEIRDSLGKDPAIDASFSTYYKAVNDHNRTAFADRKPAPVGPNESSYVGVDVCAKCHAAPKRVWDGTRHAQAYATLSTQFKEYNLDCVGCHVTGYDRPGGSTVTYVDTLKNVQCEVCHGPGSRHVKDPSNPANLIRSPSPSACLACHHSPHVENFDPAAKWTAILGPGHGLPAQ